MSRSFRRPYGFITGVKSMKWWKRRGAKSIRQGCKRSLQKASMDEAFDVVIMPHKFECSGNDRWSWPCDGRAVYSPFSDRDDLWLQECKKALYRK